MEMCIFTCQVITPKQDFPSIKQTNGLSIINSFLFFIYLFIFFLGGGGGVPIKQRSVFKIALLVTSSYIVVT